MELKAEAKRIKEKYDALEMAKAEKVEEDSINKVTEKATKVIETKSVGKLNEEKAIAMALKGTESVIKTGDEIEKKVEKKVKESTIAIDNQVKEATEKFEEKKKEVAIKKAADEAMAKVEAKVEKASQKAEDDVKKVTAKTEELTKQQ